MILLDVNRRTVPLGRGSNTLILNQDRIDLWSAQSCAAVTGIAGDPIGGSNACRLTPAIATARHYMFQLPSSTPFVQGDVAIVQAYVKYDGTAGWGIVGDDQHNSFFRTLVNLQTGALGSADAGVTASSVSAGNGWWLVTARYTIPADHSTTSSCIIGCAPTNSFSSYLASTETMLAWRGHVRKAP